MKTFKFKLYCSKKTRRLDHQLWVACKVYNHAIALHRRYWKLYHKSLFKFTLQKHLVKLKKLPRYAFWNDIPSHAIQDITDRIPSHTTWSGVPSSRGTSSKSPAGSTSFPRAATSKEQSSSSRSRGILAGTSLCTSSATHPKPREKPEWVKASVSISASKGRCSWPKTRRTTSQNRPSSESRRTPSRGRTASCQASGCARTTARKRGWNLRGCTVA